MVIAILVVVGIIVVALVVRKKKNARKDIARDDDMPLNHKDSGPAGSDGHNQMEDKPKEHEKSRRHKKSYKKKH